MGAEAELLVKTAEAVITVRNESNSETIKVNVRIMIVANQNGNGQGKLNGNRGNNSNRDRNFQGKQRNDQGRNKRNDAARNNQAGPRIDFKVAASKAEQMQSIHVSETRFREEKLQSNAVWKEQEKARKEKQQAEASLLVRCWS